MDMTAEEREDKLAKLADYLLGTFKDLLLHGCNCSMQVEANGRALKSVAAIFTAVGNAPVSQTVQLVDVAFRKDFGKEIVVQFTDRPIH